MSQIRKRRRIRLHLAQWTINTFFKGTHYFAIKRHLLRSAGLIIAENAKIVGPIHFDTNMIDIGKNTWIGKNFCVYGNGSVKVGSDCDLAPDIILETGSHKIGTFSHRAGEGYCGEIIIGNGCWLGIRTTLLPNIKIGDGSIIAAGAVVNKDVDSNLLVGGIPCKTIRKIEDE